jgi:hypothetical protein
VRQPSINRGHSYYTHLALSVVPQMVDPSQGKKNSCRGDAHAKVRTTHTATSERGARAYHATVLGLGEDKPHPAFQVSSRYV